MNDILSKIKESLKEGEIVEDIDINPYEEEKEINYPTNRKMKPSLVKKCLVLATLGLSIAVASPSIVPNEITKVEAAKKDKRKPKITMKGKSKINTNVNKSIKLGKVTANDNRDGNVTKKISVTVKKDEKSYSSIAKKIKKNKSIKFSEEGIYVVTYTVKDKAGNKATKKRYITVTNPKIKNEKTTEVTTENITTEKTTETPKRVIVNPTPSVIVPTITTEEKKTETTTERNTSEERTTQVTTERITTEATTEATTENKTTEAITTESDEIIIEPEKPTPTDFSKYNINEVNVNGKKFKVTSDENFQNDIIEKKHDYNENIKFSIENDYNEIDMSMNNPVLENYNYLKYLGNIKITNENGKDISDNIIVCDYGLKNVDYEYYEPYDVKIYVEDEDGNYNVRTISIVFPISCTAKEFEGLNFICVDEENNVFAHVRGTNYTISETKFNNKKKLVLA